MHSCRHHNRKNIPQEGKSLPENEQVPIKPNNDQEKITEPIKVADKQALLVPNFNRKLWIPRKRDKVDIQIEQVLWTL